MTPPDSSRRLGRGLGALLSPTAPTTAVADPATESVQRIPIAQIQPSTFQPRKAFDPAELAELAASLKASGLLQPIAVRPLRDGARPGATGRFELLAGERRLRAATHLGWSEIPAIVREVDDRTALTLALVENLQRSDLNPIEEAEGYAQLAQSFALTQQDIAEAVGKDRSTIANTLRLLNLPTPVRSMIRDGQLSVGHGRALLALGPGTDLTSLAREIITRGLTVREVEALSEDTSVPVKRHKRATKASKRLDAHGKG